MTFDLTRVTRSPLSTYSAIFVNVTTYARVSQILPSWKDEEFDAL